MPEPTTKDTPVSYGDLFAMLAAAREEALTDGVPFQDKLIEIVAESFD
jgi:hypothetical protein